MITSTRIKVVRLQVLEWVVVSVLLLPSAQQKKHTFTEMTFPLFVHMSNKRPVITLLYASHCNDHNNPTCSLVFCLLT